MNREANPAIPIWLGLAGLASVAALLFSREAEASPPAPSPILYQAQVWPAAPKAVPIFVGDPGSTKGIALLAEMRQAFRQAGIDTNLIDPVEVTRLPKAPGQPVAIPPRAYWPRMIQTIVMGFLPFRAEWGAPVRVLGGYRPDDYNAAVGGEDNSRHMWFEALDIAPVNATDVVKRAFALRLADFFVRNGQRLAMGLGVYGRVAPSGHIDTGWQDRTWGDADYWVDQYKAAA